MNWGLLRTIIVLPGTVLVFIPAIILLLNKDSRFPPKLITPSQISFWLALLAASIGVALCFWTLKLFTKYGEGTPAPWDPPRKLVIIGPYRYSRNPMITGALLLLLAEALLFHSWPIAAWMILFFVGNAIYFPLVEEKGLEKRFGNEYLKYKARVPRWIPRLRPWEKSESAQ
jgi:protein-S-isoprenylcysteine O-methyltransferase Ste14